MPFLRGTTPIWGTQDLPGRFKEWKACLVEIGQTAHKLETNTRTNFPMPENFYPHVRTLIRICGDTVARTSVRKFNPTLENMLIVLNIVVARTPSKGTHQWGQLLQLHGGVPLCAVTFVVRFPLRDVKQYCTTTPNQRS